MDLWNLASRQYGDVKSTLLLAKLYMDADDNEKSIKYWKIAANLKDPSAITFMAHLTQTQYETDDPTMIQESNSDTSSQEEGEINTHGVYEFSRQAAALGDQASLRWMAQHSEANESLDWYMEAAKAGDVSSYLVVAKVFYEGTKDVPQNLELAIEYFVMAARMARFTSTHIASLHSFKLHMLSVLEIMM
jgi:TPR repeat protein